MRVIFSSGSGLSRFLRCRGGLLIRTFGMRRRGTSSVWISGRCGTTVPVAVVSRTEVTYTAMYATGMRMPVVELTRAARPNCEVTPVLITAGERKIRNGTFTGCRSGT